METFTRLFGSLLVFVYHWFDWSSRGTAPADPSRAHRMPSPLSLPPVDRCLRHHTTRYDLRKLKAHGLLDSSLPGGMLFGHGLLQRGPRLGVTGIDSNCFR